MGGGNTTTIDVQGTAITVLSKDREDFISFTDMVKHFEGGSALIEQWLKKQGHCALPGCVGADQQPGF